MTEDKLTTSGIKIPVVADKINSDRISETPGKFPFTRGIYEDMYRGRLWTMRQYRRKRRQDNLGDGADSGIGQ